MGSGAGQETPAFSWPSAIVASMIILLIGSITVTAIIRYSMEDALTVWTAMGTIVGLFTGTFVTYFFTRGTIQTATAMADTVTVMANEANARADFEQQRHAEAQQTIIEMASKVGAVESKTLEEQVEAILTRKGFGR